MLRLQTPLVCVRKWRVFTTMCGQICQIELPEKYSRSFFTWPLEITSTWRNGCKDRWPYGWFTLPNTEANTDNDKMCTEPNENLLWSFSLRSVKTSTQFYMSHFYQSLCILVSTSVNIPLQWKRTFLIKHSSLKLIVWQCGCLRV